MDFAVPVEHRVEIKEKLCKDWQILEPWQRTKKRENIWVTVVTIVASELGRDIKSLEEKIRGIEDQVEKSKPSRLRH